MYQNLSQKQAQEKLQKDGYNEIKRKKQKTKLQVLIDVIKDPILVIMIVAMLISIITGFDEGNFSEAIVIFVLILVNITISFVQEIKTIQKLNSLEKLNEDTVIVIRDDKEIEILSKELVVGDLVKISLGSIARADIKLVESQNIRVDESFLTGESDEVEKEVGDIIYSNSPIQNGRGHGTVIATAMNTKIGSIAKQVDNVSSQKSQLELKILHISKILLIVAITTAIIISILTLLNGYSIEDTLSITISILIATVPEGLATVLAIVLTFMSQKMATNNALVKKVALLETLGEVQYVCSDKTGTITENKMSVSKHIDFIESDTTKTIKHTIIDNLTPTSRAIHTHINIDDTATISEANILDVIPFNSTIKKSISLVELDNQNYLVALGAPDFLVDNVDEKIKEVKQYASQGLRTILVSFEETNLNSLKEVNPEDIKNLTNISLYGIQDPPKESAVEAINTMHNASINTVMITGDNLETAKAIAKQANIITSDNDLFMTGEELSLLSDEQFSQIVESVKVYARVKPEDKLRIVAALQAHNKIVAMTGDGTNDSIALKKANVGVAMGHQGTDIAKESADLILLDDNFATINEAIAGGRLIFDNLRKFIRQMLTSNTAHVGGILFALIYGLFSQNHIILPMTAVLILWVNVVSDAIPCLALGLDKEEKDLMHRAPIDPNMKLLDISMLIEILVRGLGIGLLVFISFNLMLNATNDEQYARTIAFVVLSFGQLIHIFDARSFNTIYKKNPFENKLIWLAVGFSALLNLAIIYLPVNNFFGLVPISLTHLVLAILIASTVTFGFSIIKLIYLKIRNN